MAAGRWSGVEILRQARGQDLNGEEIAVEVLVSSSSTRPGPGLGSVDSEGAH